MEYPSEPIRSISAKLQRSSRRSSLSDESPFEEMRSSESSMSEASFSSTERTPEADPLLGGGRQESDLEDSSPSPRIPVRDSPTAEDVAEEQILKVVDQFEDEWDEHTYEELVPLEIRLALEQNVFGWSHLSSNILGHTVFTVGAFALVYVALLLLTSRLTWLRWILSVLAAWSSYRMVRRRRKVWLRAPYGSKKYRQDEARRRKEVAQADKLGWVRRLRNQRSKRRVERQLKRAETSFLKHHERHLKRAESDPLSPKTATPSKRRRQYFWTDPVPVMHSIQQDQIVFAKGRIRQMPYTHGGFFGAAPFMLANPHWISILRLLMPDVYVEISRRIQAPPQSLIHWAENNPVVAAYGTAHELEYNGAIPNIEWDVFLDPSLVRKVEVVLREREKFLQTLMLEVPIVKPLGKVPEIDGLSSSQRNVLRYYGKELRKRVELLIDKMLIAHGNLTQLILEQTGICKRYNYSRVKRTRRTLGGGIYARQWMAVYAESLRVGLREESPPNSPSPSSDSDSISLNAMAASSCPNTSIADSVAIVKSIAKREDPMGLVLDIKSRHVPKPVWACVVDALREDGIRVEGVGSFFMEEVRLLNRYTVEPVKEMLFFHSAGDMQQACHERKIRFGDTVIFNGGSLLWEPPSLQDGTTIDKFRQCCASFDAEYAKQRYRLLPHARTSKPSEDGSYSQASATAESTVEAYKRRYNLSIGLYVQEFAIDEAAANLLAELVNDSPHVYDLGLSWGGVNGITIRGIQPGRFTCTDGFWNQRHIGAVWDSSLVPPV